MDDVYSRLARRADEESLFEAEPADKPRAKDSGKEPAEQPDMEEEPIEFDKLPAAVKKSVEEHMPGASGFDAVRLQLGEVELYNVVAHRSRTGLGITVAASGELVEMERDIAPSRVPKAVKTTLAGYYPDAVFTSAGSVTIHFYEFEYEDDDGNARVVQVDAGGRILQDVEEADA